MRTFQDRIRATRARVNSYQASGPPVDFIDILEEFVSTLKTMYPFLGAAIEKGKRQQMWSFVTWPRYRRNERTIMLTFWWDGETMKALGDDKPAPFDTPEELKDYLVDFLENSAFDLTLETYGELCHEEIEGFLRTASLVQPSADDVMVIVDAADQQAIATAHPGDQITLKVNPYGNIAAYLANTQEYGWLSSGGYGLRITEHRQEGEDIVIIGTAMEDGAVE